MTVAILHFFCFCFTEHEHRHMPYSTESVNYGENNTMKHMST